MIGFPFFDEPVRHQSEEETKRRSAARRQKQSDENRIKDTLRAVCPSIDFWGPAKSGGRDFHCEHGIVFPMSDLLGVKDLQGLKEWHDKVVDLIRERTNKLETLSKAHWAKVKPINDEFTAQVKPINDEFTAQKKVIDTEFNAKIHDLFKKLGHRGQAPTF